MGFGDGLDDEALQSAWTEFCAQLQRAGERVFKDANPAAALQRVDAYRFLTQNLGQAFDLALETRDTSYPVLHTFCGPTRKLGGDCADFTYQQAWIDGHSTYRLTGTRGTARFFNVTVQGRRAPGPGVLHEPFGDTPQANLLGHQLDIGDGGRFELYIGGPERGTNWLPTTPESRKLFIRQGFDRWDESPAQMRIERIDMASPKPLPSPTDMVEAMRWAGEFVTGLMCDWPEFPFNYGGVDAEHQGLASGLFNTSQQIGGALGLAVLSTVATSATHGTADDALVHGYTTAFAVGAGLLVAAVAVIAVSLRSKEANASAAAAEGVEALAAA